MQLIQTTQKNLYAWLLLAVCAASLFLFLGSTLFNTRGEPREAVVALSMIQDGNWILPINNGTDMAYKPPFFHWLAALCGVLTGGMSEYAARMPSAIALTVMVMAGYLFYARRTDVRTALLMGLLTLSNFEVHRAGVACRVDMVLTCMMVLALYALYAWVEKGMKRLPLAGILLLSGAFLSKGPVGAALPCLTVALFAWMRGGKFVRILWKFAVVGILSCLLPLVWYLAAYTQGGERFLGLVYEENVLRLLGKMSYDSHVNPWYYNVMTIVSGFVPYTLLLLMSLFVLRYRRISTPAVGWWSALKARLQAMSDVQLFSLLSFVVIFIFYCIPKSKRSVYLLPVYPFLAYWLAVYLLWLCRNHRRVVAAFTGFVATLGAVLTLMFVAMRTGMLTDALYSLSLKGESREMLNALLSAPLSALQWVTVIVPVVALFLFRSTKSPLRRMLLVVFALFFALDGTYQPLVLNVKSDKPVADCIAALQPEGSIYSFRTDVVKGNEMHPFTINYYLADRVVPFEMCTPNEGLLIVGNREIEDFCKTHTDYEVSLVKDFQHRSCDDHKDLFLYRFSQNSQK